MKSDTNPTHHCLCIGFVPIATTFLEAMIPESNSAHWNRSTGREFVASIRLDKTSGNYFIRFRYAGIAFNRSLKTAVRKEANAIKGRVTETILLLERGRLEMPDSVDPAAFILSDGKVTERPTRPKVRTLSDLFRIYNQELPVGAKEENTLAGEKRHQRFLKKHLKASTIAQHITVADVQEYVRRRSNDTWNGENISVDTIRKELATFRLIWNWAVARDYLKGAAPTRGVRFPKSADKPPFMTTREITDKINRGGLTPKQQRRLWESLFLTVEDVSDVLKYVQAHGKRAFIYPMFVFVAHTGARRSELLRSRIDDFDFNTGIVRIREKKKNKLRKITFRHVEMSDHLSKTMQDWFSSHPGGQFTLCDDPTEIAVGLDEDEVGMSPDKAQNHFDRVLEAGDWGMIRGFHVFRHSFASNLAAAGVDQRIIDDWMGHQTDEMRRRYRHLFPKQRRSAIDSVFGGSGQ